MEQRRDLTWDYICELEAQRDELVAALRRLSRAAQTTGGAAGGVSALTAEIERCARVLRRTARAARSSRD